MNYTFTIHDNAKCVCQLTRMSNIINTYSHYLEQHSEYVECTRKIIIFNKH
jgi:hypothetical protein